MKRLNKTLRRKLQRRQRSRNTRRYRKRQTRRKQKQRGGGSLPVPAGALVAISSGGEYGMPMLMSKERAEELQESGGLED